MLKPHITKVIPLKNYRLYLQFENGEQRIFDVTPYLSGDWFGELKDPKVFATAHCDGHTVVWQNGQDIAPHELYDNSLHENTAKS